MNTYNKINWKCPRILMTHFYRLVQFRIRRRFHASLSVRVSYSGHPVYQVRKYCTDSTGHKIYHFMPARSTWRYKLLHNHTIQHTKTFLHRSFTRTIKIFRDKAVILFTDTPMIVSHIIVHFKIRFKHKFESKISPFYFFTVRVRVQPATIP